MVTSWRFLEKVHAEADPRDGDSHAWQALEVSSAWNILLNKPPRISFTFNWKSRTSIAFAMTWFHGIVVDGHHLQVPAVFSINNASIEAGVLLISAAHPRSQGNQSRFLKRV